MGEWKSSPYTPKEIGDLINPKPVKREKQKVKGKAAQWGGSESNDFDPTLESLRDYRKRLREDQDARDKEQEERREARASKKAREEAERAAAIAKFKSCRLDAGCTCGDQPCPQQLLHFCEAWNTVKKRKCRARACVEALKGAGGQCGSEWAAGAGGAAGADAEEGGAEN